MQRAISQDDDVRWFLAGVLAKQEIVRAQQIGHGMGQPWVSPAWCEADHAVVQKIIAASSQVVMYFVKSFPATKSLIAFENCDGRPHT